jgi:predicted permease
MSIARDVHYALRLLRRTPAFTLPAVASLALGIAVNTTMFSVVNAVMLRPVGAPADEELVRIGRSRNHDGTFRSISAGDIAYLREQGTVFSGLAGHQIESVAIGSAAGAHVVSAEIVTSNYFALLGVPASLGRTFSDEDGGAATDRAVAVVSDRFWRGRLGGREDVVGQHVPLNGRPFTIVGVAEPSFRGTFPGVDVDLWLPASMANAIAHRPANAPPPSLMVLGRLKPDASPRAARAQLDVLAARMSEQADRDRSRTFTLATARGIHPGFARIVGPFLLLLMAVVTVVLLIACANVASLLLARAGTRRSELAIRLASGAGRGRLIRQLLVESALLAAVGGVIGLVVSIWAVRLLNAFALAAGPTGAPISFALQLDRRVLLFTLIVTALTTLACGLVPAFQTTRTDILAALKDSVSFYGRRTSRLRGSMLVVQIALSFVLLVAAALLFRSISNTARIDLGFDPDGVVVTSFNLQMLGYDQSGREHFYGELLRRVRGTAVECAAVAEFVPMGGRGSSVAVTIPGVALPPSDAQLAVGYNGVSDGYFAAIGHALVRGREFAPTDRSGPPVVIINEAMARRFWPRGDAIGKRMRLAGDGADREIVGIARDARYGTFGAAAGPFIFLPLTRYPSMLTLFVRTTTAPADALSGIARITRELDSSVAPQSPQTMREAAALALVPLRVGRLVFGVAGAIAFLLAFGGLYGLVSYTLEQRLKEIGIRVALGARRRNIFEVIVGGAVRITIVGVAAGLALAAAATRLLSAVLYGVSPTDALTFGGIAALLIAMALAAGYAAARKGLSVDPAVVLRRG